MIPHPRVQNKRRAFSLVELVLALGIVSFLIIPMVMLLGVGVNTMKSSMIDVKTSSLAQKYMAAAQMAPFQTLATQTRYVDFDGRDVPLSEAIFVVTTTVDAANLLTSSNLTRVTVTFTGSGTGNIPRKYSAFVANLGH
jgi:uncharacterized protein (TIGR02598 family)